MKSDYKQSLIIDMPSWVGDCIMTLPTLDLLTQSGFECILYGKKWLGDLFSSTHYQCLIKDKKSFDAMRQWRSVSARNALLLRSSWSSAMLARFSQKKTVGYQNSGRGLLLNCAVNRPQLCHEVEYYWKLGLSVIDYFGHQPAMEKPGSMCLPMARSVVHDAEKILSADGVQDDYWLLLPSAIGNIKGKSKVWPHWQALFLALQSRGINLIGCPGPNETMLIKNMLPELKQIPNIGLKHLPAILSRAQMVISNDTGPMHIAASVGVPVLGIFGVSDPRKYFPWGGEFIGSDQAWPNVAAVLERLNQMAVVP